MYGNYSDKKMHPVDYLLKVVWIVVGILIIISVFVDAF